MLSHLRTVDSLCTIKVTARCPEVLVDMDAVSQHHRQDGTRVRPKATALATAMQAIRVKHYYYLRMQQNKKENDKGVVQQQTYCVIGDCDCCRRKPVNNNWEVELEHDTGQASNVLRQRFDRGFLISTANCISFLRKNSPVLEHFPSCTQPPLQLSSWQ